MRYRHYLILFIFIILLPGIAFAQDQRYRVELIVLTHLDRDEEPRELPQIADYSHAVDFLTPPPEADEESADVEDSADAELPEALVAEAAGEVLAEEPEPETDPNRLDHIEEMSDGMQESWRRLRLSAPFRPEQYLSWEQGELEPFPVLRVHDLEAVMTVDPWADLRAELQEQEAELAEVSSPDDTTDPDETTNSGDSLPTGEEAEEPGIPDPIVYYRLDGSASLTRSRFLHFEVDLQLRTAIWDPEMILTPTLDSGEEPIIQPSSFMVHSLQQSRQVKTGRMEYFDGPVLSVLVYITAIEVEEEDTP